MAEQAVIGRGLSIRLACQAFQISQACYRYKAQRCIEDDEIAQWLLRLTDNNRNWGFGLCFLYLRNVRGLQWNTSGFTGFTGSWNSIYGYGHAGAWSEPNLSH